MPPKFKRNIQCILLKNIYKTTRTHTYGTITLYGATIPSQLQLNKKRSKIKSKTPHLHIPHSTGFSLSYIVFARRY